MKREGLERDFDRVYERFHREVWALAYARTLDRDIALDLTQETFLRLWREWENGVTIEFERAWLMRVCRNLAEDHAKSAFRRNGTSDPEAMRMLGSREKQPHDALQDTELFAAVRSVLDLLPVTDRDVLTLRYTLDYEPAQIAEILELQPSAVYVRLSRARQKLAAKLKQLGLEPNQ